jgi:fatty-acid desaturase
MYAILVAQIFSFICLIYLVFHGSPLQWAGTILIYFLMAGVGGTVTFHRLLAHHSWPAPRWFYYLGTIFGSLSWSGSGLAWAAVHREHHLFSDTEKDPHSPLHRSFFSVQCLTMLHQPKLKYVTDLSRDPAIVFLHRNYIWLNLAYDLILYFIDPFAIIYLHYAPACLTWHGGSFINSLCHSKGEVLNVPWLGFFVFGEGWHKNHHDNPQSERFQKKWWQLDIGYLVICLCRTQKN